MKRRFDINAPLSQQKCVDKNCKILKIIDSGLQIDYPITVFFDGEQYGKFYTREGCYYKSGQGSNYDLITVDKPLVVEFRNAYDDGLGGSFQSVEAAKQGGVGGATAILKITFDPNNNTVTSEVVHEY